jgi:hypothetical protein
MSTRTLAFVGCRLLAVYVLLSVIQAQTHNLFFYLQSLNRVVQNVDFDPYFYSALLNFVAALILWFRADWFAARIAAGTPEPQQEEPATWSPKNALSVVVIATGLWVLILLVPRLSILLQQFLEDGRVDTISFVFVALSIAVGVVCIFSPRGIAEVIARGRRW